MQRLSFWRVWCRSGKAETNFDPFIAIVWLVVGDLPSIAWFEELLVQSVSDPRQIDPLKCEGCESTAEPSFHTRPTCGDNFSYRPIEYDAEHSMMVVFGVGMALILESINQCVFRIADGMDVVITKMNSFHERGDRSLSLFHQSNPLVLITPHSLDQL